MIDTKLCFTTLSLLELIILASVTQCKCAMVTEQIMYKILFTFYKSQLSLQKFTRAVLSKIHPVLNLKLLKIQYSMNLIPTPRSSMWSHQP